MKTLINTSLFNLFTAYINGTERAVEELPAAYENFVDLLAELPQEEDLMKRLRRLNYTKIELAFMQRICNDMPEEQRHVLYDVFIGKALALLDAEAEMIKDSFRHSSIMAGLKTETVQANNGRKAAVRLTWNGTVEGRELKVVDVIRVFEEIFHLKINALYTKRGKVFDRCTDTTPFIDSLRKSYNQMLDKRLA